MTVSLVAPVQRTEYGYPVLDPLPLPEHPEQRALLARLVAAGCRLRSRLIEYSEHAYPTQFADDAHALAAWDRLVVVAAALAQTEGRPDAH